MTSFGESASSNRISIFIDVVAVVSLIFSITFAYVFVTPETFDITYFISGEKFICFSADVRRVCESKSQAAEMHTLELEYLTIGKVPSKAHFLSGNVEGTSEKEHKP